MRRFLDYLTQLRYRLFYCARYGHLDKGWGYCANCGKTFTRRTT